MPTGCNRRDITNLVLVAEAWVWHVAEREGIGCSVVQGGPHATQFGHAAGGVRVAALDSSAHRCPVGRASGVDRYNGNGVLWFSDPGAP